MDNTKDIQLEPKKLSADNNYYQNVFKKTEKILSVILYIVSESHIKDEHNVLVGRIKDKALHTHELSLQTLRLPHHQRAHGLKDFQYGLVETESALTLAELSGLISREVAGLVHEQIDTVHRYLNHHYPEKSPVTVSELTAVAVERNTDTKSSGGASAKKRSAPTPRRSSRVNIPAGDISSDAYLVYSQLTDRAERIRTVLEAKPQATVKDIAEVITDVSEKTIQRELNSLIEKGQVIREGERRWSKYSVKK